MEATVTMTLSRNVIGKVDGYFWTANSIVAQDISNSAYRVLSYLIRKANKKGVSYPSLNEFRDMLKMSKTTVVKAIKELCESGLVSKKRRPRPARKEGEHFFINNEYRISNWVVQSKDRSSQKSEHKGIQEEKIDDIEKQVMTLVLESTISDSEKDRLLKEWDRVKEDSGIRSKLRYMEVAVETAKKKTTNDYADFRKNKSNTYKAYNNSGQKKQSTYKTDSVMRVASQYTNEELERIWRNQ